MGISQNTHYLLEDIIEYDFLEILPDNDDYHNDHDYDEMFDQLALNLANEEDLMRIVYYYDLNILNRDEEVLAKRIQRKTKTVFYQQNFDENIGSSEELWAKIGKNILAVRNLGNDFEKIAKIQLDLDPISIRQCWSFKSYEYSKIFHIDEVPLIPCTSRIHTMDCPSSIIGNSDYGIGAMMQRAENLELIQLNELLRLIIDFDLYY